MFILALYFSWMLFTDSKGKKKKGHVNKSEKETSPMP